MPILPPAAGLVLYDDRLAERARQLSPFQRATRRRAARRKRD